MVHKNRGRSHTLMEFRDCALLCCFDATLVLLLMFLWYCVDVTLVLLGTVGRHDTPKNLLSLHSFFGVSIPIVLMVSMSVGGWVVVLFRAKGWRKARFLW